MNDKLLMDNYLMVLKSTIEVYVHGTLESSNQDIRELLHNGLNSTLTHQANTYDLMAKYGFYQVNNVMPQTINQTLTKINSQN
jgi:spore coat protein CotF